MDRLFTALSPEEFEHLQLEADHVFCRRCGLAENTAVPMEHVGMAYLDEYDGAAGVGSYHVYKCPRCGHRGMSEQTEVNRDGVMDEDRVAYDNGLTRCPGCGGSISFSVPADVVVLDLGCPECGTVFQIEKPADEGVA